MIPTPHTVRVREPVSGEEDEFGNAAAKWVEADWAVHAIAPGAMVEPDMPNRDLSVVEWTVYGPKVGAYPRSGAAEVRLQGEDVWHAVEGDPDDWTRGPWPNPVAGVVVLLRRTEG